MKEKIQILIDNGLTVVSIARATGIDNSQISKWLKGNKTISETNEQKLRDWLEDFKKLIADL